MILCDTGPLVAAFNEADNDHVRCVRFLRENWSRVVVPSLAITEICHLLADPARRGRPSLAAEFCAAIADDELRVIEVTPYDYRRMSELLTTHSSLRLQAVDGCVVALAERLDLHEIAALDRRDFQVVAPSPAQRGSVEASARQLTLIFRGRSRPGLSDIESVRTPRLPGRLGRPSPRPGIGRWQRLLAAATSLQQPLREVAALT